MEYKLVTAEDNDLLNQVVNGYLDSGWSLYGSPTVGTGGSVVTYTIYGQALIRRKDPPEPQS